MMVVTSSREFYVKMCRKSAFPYVDQKKIGTGTYNHILLRVIYFFTSSEKVVQWETKFAIAFL